MKTDIHNKNVTVTITLKYRLSEMNSKMANSLP